MVLVGGGNWVLEAFPQSYSTLLKSKLEGFEVAEKTKFFRFLEWWLCFGLYV